ncbi:MAG TPA: NAD(P)-binding domain-containing protein [Kofleriaceae bacterium]|nr:NAD(P)-binding domain-containing protein [Kofleriaceae bacterium]
MSNKVAILGSGTVGEVLANGCLKHGYTVMRGSRDPKKLDAWKAGAGGNASTGTFVEAAKWADLVIIAVKGNAAEGLVTELAATLAGKPVIDATNPIADAPPQNGVIQYFTKQNESLMERLQKAAPQAKLVKAFNSVGNALMVNPKLPIKPKMFICGNDAGAKQQVTELLGKFGWDALDYGGVESARPIESLCMLWCVPGMLRNDWMHVIDYVKA